MLNLACVMVMNPEVILLDEPTSMLDPIFSAKFLNTLKRINDDFGTYRNNYRTTTFQKYSVLPTG